MTKARVLPKDVMGIIEIKDTNNEIDPMIALSHTLVEDRLAGSGYSEDLLKEIEKWLAAHFYAVRYPRTASKSAQGGGTVQYDGQTGLEGLKQTRYGTQVMLLDYKGILKGGTETQNRSSFEGLI
jgi:hypothetical protein